MTLTITATAEHVVAPRVALTITSSPTISAELAVTRVHADGSEHRVILQDSAVLLGSFAGLDYHPPFNQVVGYRAVAGGQTSNTATVVVPSPSVWLIHRTNPALSMRVPVTADVADYVYADRSSLTQVLNRRLPVSRADYERGGEEGQLTIICPTPAHRTALKKLLAAGGPTLLNSPYSDDDLGWQWVQFGALTIKNPGERQAHPERMAVLPYREVEQPDSDQQLPTFAERQAQFPTATFDDMRAVYATFDDAKLDKRIV